MCVARGVCVRACDRVYVDTAHASEWEALRNLTYVEKAAI
jgi:hypothetical protein